MIGVLSPPTWIEILSNRGKTRQNGRNVTLIQATVSVASSMSRPWIGWIGSAPVQMSGCCLGSALSWWCDGLLLGLGVLRWPFVSREQSHCAFLGSVSCVFTYWESAAPLLSLQSFYNYARGHCEVTRNFFRVVHSVFVSVWNSKTALAAVCELFWGMLGRGNYRWTGIGVSGSGYNEVLALEVLNVIDCVERKRREELLASASGPRTVTAVPSFQACLCACICTCVYMCMYVSRHFMKKTRQNGKKMTSFWGPTAKLAAWVGHGWIGSALVQISRCGLDSVLSWWCDDLLLVVLWLFCTYLSFLVDGQLGYWPR